uniref:Uncharacterized protein n=1 Tax=Anguilla anguilla TaxID=7936 RepID=A0A0E9XPB5_ANGAN
MMNFQKTSICLNLVMLIENLNL